MKRSTFTDEQILAIVKEGEAGRKVLTCAGRTPSASLDDTLVAELARQCIAVPHPITLNRDTP